MKYLFKLMENIVGGVFFAVVVLSTAAAAALLIRGLLVLLGVKE